MPEPRPEPRQLLDLMPFALALGIDIDEARPERVTGRMSWAPSAAPRAGRSTAGR